MVMDDAHCDIAASYTNVKRRGRGLNIKGRYSMIADPDDDVAMHTDGVNSKGFGRLEDEIPREDKDEMAAALTADGAVAARCKCRLSSLFGSRNDESARFCQPLRAG